MDIAEELLKGNRLALSRAITAIENEYDEATEIMKKLYPRTGHAFVLGVTGPPGAGKSTLTDKLAREYRNQGKTVGIIAVDPTSPFTGGAILGDRIRMNGLTLDEGVFIRSMGTRGSLGGLSHKTADAVKAMEGRQSFDTWTEAFLDILHQIRDNKALVLNVYRSVGREQVEQYLYKLLDPMLKEFADRECRDITVQDDDKQFVVDFYKYALVGVVLEWIRRDMKTEPAVMVERMGRMLQGDLRRALCRLASNKIHLEQDG